VCVDYSIDTINFDVHDASNTLVASYSFDCSAHEGLLDEVPVGSGLRLTVIGTTVSGSDDWWGEILDITVRAGQTTELGTVDVSYIGDDAEPPRVVSTNLNDGAIDVSIAIALTATFNEDIVTGSMNSSTFRLESATAAVSGIVTYNPSSRIATFTPDNNLDHFTTYTATITTGVEDRAGINLAADFTWSFTTIRGPLVWDSSNWNEANWN